MRNKARDRAEVLVDRALERLESAARLSETVNAADGYVVIYERHAKALLTERAALLAERDALLAEKERRDKEIDGWADVLETCLPTDEGYDDDTEQVLGNVIRSMRTARAKAATEEQTP